MGDRNTVTFSYQQTITDDEFAFPLLTWKQPSVNAYGSMPTTTILWASAPASRNRCKNFLTFI